jgi:hypothetical protein
MRLYVAGPMTGIEECNYPEFFRIEKVLRDQGYDVLNPARIDELYNPTKAPRPWEWYMGKAIHMLVACKGVATLAGWQASRGATIEVNLANALGMGVRPWFSWPEVRVNGL